MCLAIPGEVVELLDYRKARIRFGASEMLLDLSLVEEVKVGDYIIAHSGFAIAKLDDAEARIQLALWKEYEQAMSGVERRSGEELE